MNGQIEKAANMLRRLEIHRNTCYYRGDTYLQRQEYKTWMTP